MMALLKDMLGRGNPIDIAWFVVGIWLLLFLLATLGYQVYLRVFRRRPKSSDPEV